MNKDNLIQAIIQHLKGDHALLLKAARTAHAAATDAENIPDNKYETLALEASYVAQGQANRAQEIERSMQILTQLQLQRFDAESVIRLTALIELEDELEQKKWIFLVPVSGGLTIKFGQETVQLVTPASPLGNELLGSSCGDVITLGDKEYELLSVK